MNRYQPNTPRAAMLLAAFALSALTMAAMVAAPTAIQDDATLLASRKPAIEVTITPSRIDVVASRAEAVLVSQVSATR